MGLRKLPLSSLLFLKNNPKKKFRIFFPFFHFLVDENPKFSFIFLRKNRDVGIVADLPRVIESFVILRCTFKFAFQLRDTPKLKSRHFKKIFSFPKIKISIPKKKKEKKRKKVELAQINKTRKFSSFFEMEQNSSVRLRNFGFMLARIDSERSSALFQEHNSDCTLLGGWNVFPRE